MSLPTKAQPLSALFALGLTLSFLGSSVAVAQVVQGRVVDRAAGTPILGVSVSLSDTVGSLWGSARTDSSGAYVLSGRGAGIYHGRPVRRYRDLDALSRWTAEALIFAGLFAWPAQPFAQSISGRVTDALSGDALPGAEVLAEQGGVRIARALTDSIGSFSLSLGTLSARDPVILRVRRIGYLMAVRKLSPDTAALDQFLHTALKRAPVALGEIVVHAERMERRLRLAGFYERARRGFGHFITEEHIRARNPRLLSDALRGEPGLTVAPSSRRAGANLVYVARAQGRLTGGACLPKVFLDGVMTDNDFDNFLTPEEIAGIEIYRGPAETPAQFGGAESDCGVVVIWTR